MQNTIYILDVEKYQIITALDLNVEINFTSIQFGKEDNKLLLCNKNLVEPLFVLEFI